MPLLHNCNPDDAEIIYEELLGHFNVGDDVSEPAGKTPFVDFARVKDSLERNYHCLRISCAKIGGIWNKHTNDYVPSARPCVDDPLVWPTQSPTTDEEGVGSSLVDIDGDNDSSRSRVKTFMGVIGGIACVGLVTWSILACARRHNGTFCGLFLAGSRRGVNATTMLAGYPPRYSDHLDDEKKSEVDWKDEAGDESW